MRRLNGMKYYALTANELQLFFRRYMRAYSFLHSSTLDMCWGKSLQSTSLFLSRRLVVWAKDKTSFKLFISNYRHQRRGHQCKQNVKNKSPKAMQIWGTEWAFLEEVGYRDASASIYLTRNWHANGQTRDKVDLRSFKWNVQKKVKIDERYVWNIQGLDKD